MRVLLNLAFPISPPAFRAEHHRGDDQPGQQEQSGGT
jgi:hypothetical protein